MSFIDDFGRRSPDDPDFQAIIRKDRALAYFVKETQKHLDVLRAKSTKTLGDYNYVIFRLAGQIRSVFSSAGDNNLARLGYDAIGHLGHRTPRSDGIKALQLLQAQLDKHRADVEEAESAALQQRLSALGPSQSPGADGRGSIDVSSPQSVFVIMPFASTFTDVWLGAIDKAAKELNLNPIRVDMIDRSSNITDDIVDSIRQCHVAVIDVSDNNPNVMFELGYALALEKPAVIISQSTEFLPFDIRNIRAIVYENSWSGIEELRGKLKDFLSNSLPRKKSTKKKVATGKK